MLFQEPRQVAATQVLGGTELDPQHVHAGLLAVDAGVEAQAGNPPLGEAALGSGKVQVDGVELLGLHRGPGLALLRHVKRHDLLVVPQQLAVGRRFVEQFHQLLEHLHLPLDLAAEGKTAAGEMPLAAELLPGLQDVGRSPGPAASICRNRPPPGR